MQKIKTDHMKFTDIVQVMELERKSGLECWSENNYKESLNNENYTIVVARAQDKIVGFLSMYVVADEGYICNIAVEKDFRHCGIGTTLAKRIIEDSVDKGLKFLSLEVRESNVVATRFYERLGFVRQGERKNFYSNPTESATIMTKYF